MFRKILQIRKSLLASRRRRDRSRHHSSQRVRSFEALEGRQLMSADLVLERPAGLAEGPPGEVTEEMACFMVTDTRDAETILGDIEAFFLIGAAENGRRSESSSEEGIRDEPNDQSRRASDPTVTRSGTPVQQPTVPTISAQTTGNVPDGGTPLLGGIKRLSEGRGVPMLAKLPYINPLFKNVGISRETQSLMRTVTPRIIIQEEEEEKKEEEDWGPSSLREPIHLANDDPGPNSLKEPESDGDEVRSQAFEFKVTLPPTDIDNSAIISADRRYK